MTLAEIRKMFVKLSGRHDLVLPDGSDDGADFFIHAGQRFLDLLFDNQSTFQKVSKQLDYGEYSVAVKARSVESVMCSNGEYRWPLEKILFSDMNKLYSVPVADVTKSVVLYYTPVSSSITEQSGDVFNSIMVYPPTDDVITLDIYGRFSADDLDSDSATNFWTLEHPDLLILSAMREVEIINRNREGVKDYETSITNKLMLVDKDFVAQETAEFDSIGG